MCERGNGLFIFIEILVFYVASVSWSTGSQMGFLIRHSNDSDSGVEPLGQ